MKSQAIVGSDNPLLALDTENLLAVIGLACRFPGGAETPEKFWALLRDGVDAIGEIPLSRWETDRYAGQIPNYGGFIEGVERFDAPFFHVSPREAAALDPQQRLLLEVSWEALENAGVNPHTLRGSDAGVFVGISSNDYQRLQVQQAHDPDFYLNTGTSAATASGRLSYFFGFHGPAVSVDTASSSSLVAVHLAAMSLQAGECQLALAAGVNLILSPDTSLAFSRAGMLSPDGRSKGFDAQANGYVRGEGCGVVVLKRLADAQRDGDPILALVRGTAINQDGASQGLTVPSGASQEAVARRALAAAALPAQEISYIEAHGSGTPVGDPIEGNALQAVYGSGRAAPFYIGSVKTNIGHLEAAAGIAGVIKSVLALQHRTIPAHLHFQSLNPKLAGLQATIPTRTMAWPTETGRPRRAAVSSFGYSGTNAHVILEEAPSLPSTGPATSARGYQLLALSAHSAPALAELARRYLALLQAQPELSLADLCAAANRGRAHFAHRLAAVAASTDELQEQLQAFVDGEESPGLAAGRAEEGRAPRIAFLFTGGGAQYVEMGRALYQSDPLFRQILDECDRILQDALQPSLLAAFYPPSGQPSPLDEMAYMQPALFAIEYALAKRWEAWGIRPAWVMGHSAGEFAAAALAGIFSFADGLRLIARRGELMGQTAQGAMVAVDSGEAQAREAIGPEAGLVSVAVVNGGQSVVLSGDPERIEQVLTRLPGVKATRLQITCASHSPLMEPILAPFGQALEAVSFGEAHLPVVSNLTGALADESMAGPGYWLRHLRQTVRFADGMGALQSLGADIFLEIGPKPTLLGLGQTCVDVELRQRAAWLPSLRSGRDDRQQMLESLGQLYVRGAEIDWQAVAGEMIARGPLALPTYPFQRQPFWLTAAPHSPAASKGRNGSNGHNGVHSSGERLAQRLAVANDPAIRFAFDLGQEQPGYFKHHRIFGRAVAPAGLYIESTASLAGQMLGAERLRVENLSLEQALLLPEDTQNSATVQVTLTPGEEANATHFQLYSVAADDGGGWVRHASALVYPTEERGQAVNLADLRGVCSQPVDVAGFYAQCRSAGIGYGSGGGGDDPTFETLTGLWRGENATLGHICLHPALHPEARLYQPHALLIEGGIQTAMAAFPTPMQGETYLPIGVERFFIAQAEVTELWAYAVLRSADTQAETVSVDLLLFDEAGTIMDLTGLVFKRSTPESLFRAARRGAQSSPTGGGGKLAEKLAQADASRQRELVGRFVEEQARAVLGLRGGEKLPPERALKELGLDSLMSADLKNRLERELRVMIPLERLAQPGSSVQSLTALLLEKVTPSEAAPVAPQPESAGEAHTSDDFHSAALDIPQIHAVVTEQIGRKVKVEGNWVFDFASCNYLGIDLQPEIMDAIPPALKKWGVHPSWTRAVASPAIYEDLEQALARLVGAPSTLVFPAVTLLHAGVIPVLAGYDGVILKDIFAHRSIIEACRLAQTNGAETLDFRHNDVADLEAKLARYPYARTKIIAVDGVYSMSGEYPPLPEMARLARQYNAWVYIDDAHGIGVIGEHPSAEMPYGHKGNGIVRYYGLDYVRDRMIYVAGLSKSFSSFGAFITCHDQKMKDLFRSASTFIFSGPSPVASLASALAGVQLNQRDGESWRANLHALTRRLIVGAKAMGFEVINDNDFPIVCVVIGRTPDVIAACKILWEYGILITPALYPIVPRDRGLLRFSITAANTEEEIDRSLEALAAVKERLGLKSLQLSLVGAH